VLTYGAHWAATTRGRERMARLRGPRCGVLGFLQVLGRRREGEGACGILGPVAGPGAGWELGLLGPRPDWRKISI